MNSVKKKVQTNGFTHMPQKNINTTKNTINVLSKDNFRKLKIKDKKPQTVPVHIDKSILTEIRKESIENSLTEGKKHETEPQKLVEACLEKGTERMRRLGSGNVQKELNEDKELERQRALSKSKRMLLERDDKIKKLNKAIDQAQCFAARDKQVKDNQISKEFAALQDKLSVQKMEMENYAKNAELVEKERQIAAQKPIEAAKLRQQIDEKAQRAVLEREAKIAENVRLTAESERDKESQVLENIKMLEQKALHRAELARANEAIKNEKIKKQLAEKELDERLAQLARSKEEKLMEIESQKRAKKAAKEREIAELRKNQEQKKEDKSERDEILMQRAQLHAERAWKMEQLEKARQKQRQIAQIQIDRQNQIQEARDRKLSEAQKQQAEVNAIIREQRASDKREKEAQDQKAKTKFMYRESLKAQMEEKEKQVRDELESLAHSDKKRHQVSQQLENDLKALESEKLAKLSSMPIDKKYINSVERLAKNRNFG